MISGMPNERPIAATSAIGKYRELGIRQRLGVIGAGPLIGCAAEVFRIGRIDEADLDALVLERIGEQIPGAAVEIGRGDDVVAGTGEILQGER